MSRAVRWGCLGLAWVLIGVFAALDTLAERDYVDMLGASGTLPTDVLPLHRSSPYEDTYTWTRYALALQEDSGAGWRLRHTDIDNAPTGRDVHWNSAFAHLIAGAGRIRQSFTREPLETATEQSLAWINLPLFMFVVCGFSAWIARRVGVAAAILIALGMIGHRSFYEGFSPNYVDHHGLLTAATFGVVLGALFMGAGWRASGDEPVPLLPKSRGEQRTAAIVSALCGAVGLWISAASVVPIIAFVGLSGAVVGVWLGKRQTIRGGLVFDGDAWRLWGRVGFAASLLLYLLEYAPSHLGLRLEVNNPLFALAWLGGGELVASVVQRRNDGRNDGRIDGRFSLGWRVGLASAFVLAPATVVLVLGPRVFAPLDPRVRQMHAGIEEFLSLPALIRATSPEIAWRFAIGFVLAIPVLLVFRRRGNERILITFASLVVIASVGLACWQVRWWLTASGPELCLLLVASTLELGGGRWTQRVRWAAVVLLGAAFIEQASARVQLTRVSVANRAISIGDALETTYRDAAVAIRGAHPDGPVTLLASPNASTTIGYFGRFRTLASLYWENIDGVEAAARIFSAPSDDEALRLIQAHGVTDIALVTSDYLPTYLELARSGSATDELQGTFGYRLMHAREYPRWLKPIAYRPRADLPLDARPLLFEVVPNQTPFDAAWYTAVAELAARNPGIADAEFRQAVSLRAPAQRGGLLETAARTSYQWDDHALALRLLDTAETISRLPSVEASIVWILATSRDDRVRNAPLALRRAEALVAKRSPPPDETGLDVWAAALAANGRFAEAVTVAERELAMAQTAGDRDGAARVQARISTYRSGRPWIQ